MGGRISAQNWYQDKRSRRSGENGRSTFACLKAGKNKDDELDISLLCRILVPDQRSDCEVSVCADDKPTKCYHIWQNILYAPLSKDLVDKGYPLVAPRRMILISKKKKDKILLGRDIYISLYVNGKELPGNCILDKKFAQGLDIILDRLCAELPNAELSQRLMSPQNKGRLLKYFSRDFVESIKKEYSYSKLILKLPESINNNHNV